MNTARQPKGIPAGGQFAPDTRAEPEVTLSFSRGDMTPAAEMSPEHARVWIAGQAFHHLSPVIGWMHLDAADGKDTAVHNDSFKERVGRLADDVAARFAAPEADLGSGAATPPAEQLPEAVGKWVAAQASHHLSPVIGWIRRDAAKGKDTSRYIDSFHERVDLLAQDVADRISAAPQRLRDREDATNAASESIHTHLKSVFDDLTAASGDETRLTAAQWRAGAEAAAAEIAKEFTAPAPTLDGFTAAEVEDHLAREQHDRQCACDLPEDVCRTESYGENWRYRMGVPDVEGIFDTIQGMAAARAAQAAKENA